MKSLKTLANLLIVVFVVSGCSTPVNQSTETHIKDIVQSDVFSVLPQSSDDILYYSNAGEIEGEYIELATVTIHEEGNIVSEDKIMDRLKNEAKNIGGNGILIISDLSSENGNLITRDVEAIAVYALDLMPLASSTVASL